MRKRILQENTQFFGPCSQVSMATPPLPPPSYYNKTTPSVWGHLLLICWCWQAWTLISRPARQGDRSAHANAKTLSWSCAWTFTRHVGSLHSWEEDVEGMWWRGKSLIHEQCCKSILKPRVSPSPCIFRTSRYYVLWTCLWSGASGYWSDIGRLNGYLWRCLE